MINALGAWKGTMHLNLGGEGENLFQSESTLHLDRAALDQYLLAQYTWSHDGEPHQGTMIFGENECAWVDSFHTGGAIMRFSATGPFVYLGSYGAGDGSPDWGWRIAWKSESDAVHLEMTNITPDGQEEWAVRVHYQPA